MFQTKAKRVDLDKIFKKPKSKFLPHEIEARKIAKGNPNLEFLVKLNFKLHSPIRQCTTPRRGSIGPKIYEYRDYSDYVMRAKEIQKVFGIVQAEELLFYPLNTNMGFSVGFQVTHALQHAPQIESQLTPLLTFVEKQLPLNYDFDRLSQVFLSERNKELLSYFKRPKIEKRDHYTY